MNRDFLAKMAKLNNTSGGPKISTMTGRLARSRSIVSTNVSVFGKMVRMSVKEDETTEECVVVEMKHYATGHTEKRRILQKDWASFNPAKAEHMTAEEKEQLASHLLQEFPKDAEELFEAGLHGEHQRIMRAIVRPCEYTTIRVNTVLTTREKVLEELASKLEDFNLRLEATGRPRTVPSRHPVLSDVITLPSAAPCQSRPEGELKHSNSLPEVVLDRLCGEAVLRGSDAFAKGIMAASTDVKAGDRVYVTVDLEHRTTRGSKIKNHNGRRVFIGLGELVMGRAEIFTVERGLALRMLERVCTDAPPMNNLLAGHIYVQNLPSIVVPHLLGAKPGETIIDLCAGPGGKTSHIATLMENKGTLVAVDRSLKKAIEIKRLCEQWGVGDCVHALAMDSTQAVLMRPEALAKREERIKQEQEQEQEDERQRAQAQGSGGAEAEVVGQGTAADEAEQQPKKKKQKGSSKSRSTRTRQKAQREAQEAYAEVAQIREPLEIVRFAERKQQEQRRREQEQEEQEQRQEEEERKAAAKEAEAGAGAGENVGADTSALPPANKKPRRPKTSKKKKKAGMKLPPVRGFHAESFDRVLLDPPCSALGLRPRLVHECDLAEMQKYAQLQRNLMWAAVWLLKVGGTMVYSTCTFNPLENEAQVAYLLATYPLALVPLDPQERIATSKRGLAGHGLAEEHLDHVQRFDPHCPSAPSSGSSDPGGVGFFCCKFTKTGSVLAGPGGATS
eukprot:g254.t1